MATADIEQKQLISKEVRRFGIQTKQKRSSMVVPERINVIP
jgi:hypothetical protein